MRKFLALCATMFFLALTTAWAQKNTVLQGYIKDKQTGEALPGATIVEVDQEERYLHGVVTDINGFYMIKLAEENARIKVTFVGYKDQMITVNGRSAVDVQMEDDSQQLETVVVQEARYTSDGFIQMRDKVSAVTSIKIDDLEQMGVASVDEMLQGQVSGVDITALSGDPGAGMQIRIRGTATITGDREPLIILDGMPFEVDVNDGFDFNSADSEDYSQLLSISPEDIADIQISKDAQSAAVWGAKAANGIIEITTKRGRKSKPKVRYNYKFFYDVQPDPIPMLNAGDYVTLQKQALFNKEGKSSHSNVNELNYDQDWELYHLYSQETDWLDEITQNAGNQEHSVSIRGGGDKAKYNVSTTYYSQDGTTKNTSYDRLSFRANLDFDVSTRLRISSDFSYSREDNDKLYNKDTRKIARLKMPNQSIYDMDSLGNPTGQYFLDARPDAYYKSDNPVALINEATRSSINNILRSTFRLQYSITEQLLLKSNITFDLGKYRENSFLPLAASSKEWNDKATNMSSEKVSESFRSQTLTQLFYYPKLAEGHDASVMGQWSTSDRRTNFFESASGGLPSGSFDDPGVGSELSALKGGTGLEREMAALGRAFYKWNDRYMADFGVRFDASSNFGDNTKWGAFPFGGFGWRISSESFMEKYTWIDDLKVRGTFGVNGRAPKGDSHYSIYKTGSSYNGQGTVYPNNVKLNNLKWERVTQFDLGFEMSLFEGRFYMDFDVYEKKSTDLIWDLAMPTSSGFSVIKQNAGGMTNKGIELAVNTVPYKTKDWTVRVSMNVSRNLNEVDDVPETFSLEKGDMHKNGQYATKVVIGDPIGGFYGYNYRGVYTRTENALVYDRNGEVVIDQLTGQPMRMIMGGGNNYEFQGGDAIYADRNFDGEISENDVVYLGSSNPDLTGGFGFRVTYKNLTVSSNFHFRLGQEIVNEARMYAENMYGKENQSTATMNRWRYEGDETEIPRAVQGLGFNWLGSDRFVEDGSYLRWKTLSVNYSFPKKMLKRYRMDNLSLYATIRNLATFTDYTGQDPEVPLGSGVYAFGIDKSTTPPSRSFTFGLTATF
ncbi:SusC/RagA family TonB-linked outer membrane protein (plasmid) [Fulvitalea axinellae]|uniref:SusC/RagA family TonB-linked outer membrane protein n=1 Tax=Fulvitalea axinellae TaxID=1182444 RepID=A0AAU9CU64_9BACT|nr:SusC/RagA family TonB-linked outer membrane protein [Fulvitalea axinellae]